MTDPHTTRIPNDKTSEYHSWELPQIDDSTNVLSSAEKEDRERRDLERLRGNEVAGETVSSNQYKKPLTAKQISELAESARQQGYQDGLKEGSETGYKQGFESGEQKALQNSKEQIEREGERLILLINGLLDPFEKHTEHLENVLFNTIHSLTQTILKREITTDSSHIRDLVKQSIAALPGGSDNISIYVNPDDMALMNDFFIGRAVQWELSGDPSIMPGGCKVQTKESFVDFSVEKRLEQTLEKFIAGEYLGNPENEILDTPEEPIADEVGGQTAKRFDAPESIQNDVETEMIEITEADSQLDKPPTDFDEEIHDEQINDGKIDNEKNNENKENDENKKNSDAKGNDE
ncbi:MAG: flagellar assembly protein FliH [Cellvibrionaceae bacterium]